MKKNALIMTVMIAALQIEVQELREAVDIIRRTQWVINTDKPDGTVTVPAELQPLPRGRSGMCLQDPAGSGPKWVPCYPEENKQKLAPHRR